MIHNHFLTSLKFNHQSELENITLKYESIIDRLKIQLKKFQESEIEIENFYKQQINVS